MPPALVCRSTLAAMTTSPMARPTPDTGVRERNAGSLVGEAAFVERAFDIRTVGPRDDDLEQPRVGHALQRDALLDAGERRDVDQHLLVVGRTDRAQVRQVCIEP